MKTANEASPGLYTAGVVCAAVIILVYLFEIVLVVLKGAPPVTVDQWFALFRDDRILGVLRAFALDVVAVSLKVPVFIALFFFLRDTRAPYPTLVLAMVLASIGVAAYLASNVTFSMLFLSDQASAAGNAAQESELLGAGRAMLAVYNGTGPYAAFSLLAIASILMSVAMLKSGVFGTAAAVVGIMGNALELSLPPEFPLLPLQTGIVVIGLGGILIIVWYLFVILKLWPAASYRRLNGG